MNKNLKLALFIAIPSLIIIFLIYPLLSPNQGEQAYDDEYYGSVGCKQCHAKFYELWSPSHHGLAMQAITPAFVKGEIRQYTETSIMVDSSYFSVNSENDSLVFTEKAPDGILNKYNATFALGGKNIYYFLTPLDKGRLQVLPLAYDIEKKEWYNNPKSAIRHFTDGDDDEALPWRHIGFTFNTSCWGCHVSQLENNFNSGDNSYHTVWRENGISCETCHGPSREHVRVCLEAPEGTVPEDLKIIMTSEFTPEQNNASCAPCHAKMSTLTKSFMPGDRYYDNFTLTTIEHSDFYADGRDLGENYTMTGWSMSECVTKGDLDCLHCHTSSGRYRFANENHNGACMPCHTDIVNNLEAHSFHKAEGEAGKCISCHMPMTEFARMWRSDHSMRAPMPQASIEFGSPNACVICHDDMTNEWAQESLVKWGKAHHQDRVIEQARYIQMGKDGDFSKLDEMLAYLDAGKFDEIFANSMIRLIGDVNPEKTTPSILKALSHESPLVRSTACVALSYINRVDVLDSLLKMCKDEYRIVRVEAAAAINTISVELRRGKDLTGYNKALEEFITARTSRPDDWGGQAAMGNFYLNQNNLDKAIEHFDISSMINPENVGALVNSALAYSSKGNPHAAQERLEKALAVDSENEAINLNYALLMGELRDFEKAKKHFKKVLEVNGKSVVAAYNLSVMTAQTDLKEAVKYSKIAADNDKENPRYAYTYGFYLRSDQQIEKAIRVLEELRKEHPNYAEAYFLLMDIYVKNNQLDKAKGVLQQGIQNEQFPEQLRMQFQQQLAQLP
jgi:tetratricopeptide (TPR) repeat protein